MNLMLGSNLWSGLFNLGTKCNISSVDSIWCGGNTLSIEYINSLVTHVIPQWLPKWPKCLQRRWLAPESIDQCEGNTPPLSYKWDIPERLSTALSCKYDTFSMRSLWLANLRSPASTTQVKTGGWLWRVIKEGPERGYTYKKTVSCQRHFSNYVQHQLTRTVSGTRIPCVVKSTMSGLETLSCVIGGC